MIRADQIIEVPPCFSRDAAEIVLIVGFDLLQFSHSAPLPTDPVLNRRSGNPQQKKRCPCRFPEKSSNVQRQQ